MKKDYSAHVLKYFFSSEIGKQLISKMQYGVTAQRINPTKFKDIMIPDIPHNKQQELSKKIVDTDQRYEQMIMQAVKFLNSTKKEINKKMKLINIYE